MKKIAAFIVTLALYPAISSATEDAGAPQETATAQEAAASEGTAAAQEPAAAKKAVAPKKPVGRIYVIRGSVTAEQGSPVKTGGPIFSGMLVKTGEDSSALLKFDDGQLVTMQSGTSFQVRDYRYDPEQIENSKIDFAFFEGGVRFVTGLIGQKKRLAFSLVTPNATIRGDVAKFVVVKEGKLIYSKVQDGNVRITNAAGTASFKRGESPIVPSPLLLASEFYTRIPRGIFGELLAIPDVAPLIVEAAPAPTPVPVGAPSPEGVVAPSPDAVAAPSAEAVAVREIAPEPVHPPAPSALPVASASASGPAASAPAPIPVPEAAPEPAPAPVPVSASLAIPEQAAPNCTCTCACSLK